MAKLKAPLLSFGASGALGKTIVLFPWKGINAVRTYVVPSNPNTTPQQTQRGYVTAAAAKIHLAEASATHPLVSTDQVAYSLWARTLGVTMTWWNSAVRCWLKVRRAAKIAVIYASCVTTNPVHTGAIMTGYIYESTASSLVNGKIYLGTSPSNLNVTAVCVVTAGVSFTNAAASFTTLTLGVKYYWQFRPDAADPCEGANSGIYSFVAT